MKFLEQAQAYQNAFIKKSRFFTSLMLLSGVGLVAAAPFLSYETTQIQCYNKSDNVVVVTERDTVVGKGEMRRRLIETNKLKRKVRELEGGLDCSELIDDLESDREDLLERLSQCEKELGECLDAADDGNPSLRTGELNAEIERLKKLLAACEKDDDELIGVLDAEIADLKKQIEVLKIRLDKCLNAPSNDCDGIIEGYEKQIDLLKRRIEKYKSIIENCEKKLENASDGGKVFLQVHLRDRDVFKWNEHVFERKIDPANDVSYVLYHNNRSIKRDLIKNKGIYDFKSEDGHEYTLFCRELETSVYLSIEGKK